MESTPGSREGWLDVEGRWEGYEEGRGMRFTLDGQKKEPKQRINKVFNAILN